MNIEKWSKGYFKASAKNEVLFSLKNKKASKSFNIESLISEIDEKHLQFPVMVRFLEIIDRQIAALKEAFTQAIENQKYPGQYYPIYPVKVNENKDVCERVAKNSIMGFEVGNKTELILALCTLQNSESTIICNGFKDVEYIKLALIVSQLGFKVYIVIESIDEIEDIINESRALKIQPLLGIRLRLTTPIYSKWAESSGLSSKFGLSAPLLIRAIKKLKKSNLLSSVHLLHFHAGSQIKKLSDIKKVVREMAGYYVAFIKEGLSIEMVDIGGGLGVNYTSENENSMFSIDYEVEDYADVVISIFNKITLENNVSAPILLSESGRFITAHHGILLTNVISEEYEKFSEEKPPKNYKYPSYILEMLKIRKLKKINHFEFLEAKKIYADTKSKFSRGIVSLIDNAILESVFKDIAYQYIVKFTEKDKLRYKSEYDELIKLTFDRYYCNFSIFQSVPDSWALSQTFPVFILGAQEKEEYRATVLYDLTCDSDGKMVLKGGEKKSINIRKKNFRRGQYMIIFLVGAYQEAIGQMHNLFGNVTTVSILLNEKGKFELCKLEAGYTVYNSLQATKYSKNDLMKSIKKRIKTATLNAKIKNSYQKTILSSLEDSCYFNKENKKS